MCESYLTAEVRGVGGDKLHSCVNTVPFCLAWYVAGTGGLRWALVIMNVTAPCRMPTALSL